MKKCVFLDRDGVLNQMVFRMGKGRAPYTLQEFTLFSGVKEALALLKGKGFLLIVVTNQPDVARGWVTREAVDAVNQKLREVVPIDDIKVCFHTEHDHCKCRKPEPGMLNEAASEYEIDLSQSWMIGDRFSDILAGKKAGCKTILIGEGDQSEPVTPDYSFNSLYEASRLIIEL